MPLTSRRQLAIGPAQGYLAHRDYGTRLSEIDRKVFRFGNRKYTLYRRADLELSSWFFRIHLKEETRNFRNSLRTRDFSEAPDRAQSELIQLLTKVESGQRMLSLRLKDLIRRFMTYQEEQVRTEQIARTTLRLHHYRIQLGCKFLQAKLPSGNESKIVSINGDIFNHYLAWRQKAVANKGKTIRRDVVRDELLSIRKMFRYAREQHLCTDRNIPSWDITSEREGHVSIPGSLTYPRWKIRLHKCILPRRARSS
jgi:hypothetical protein